MALAEETLNEALEGVPPEQMKYVKKYCKKCMII